MVTLKIVGYSLVLTYVLGLVTALMRLSNLAGARFVSRLYLESTRNTPLLVQLYFVYFIIAPALNIDRLSAAVLALSLFEGAYASEIYRAGIVSINRGQWEAAYSLGLSTFSMYKEIILPQAIRRILPPLTGQAISLIKDSSLVSVIAVYEMTMQANAIVAETFLVFEIYFSIAVIYLILTISLSQLVNYMEKRIKIV
jgi:polar amino acid transport system permease protein